MVFEQIHVAVAQLLAVHLLDAVSEQAAVQADETLLGQLADECGYVLVLHIGVGVVFGAGGGIGGVAVVHEEAHLVGRFAVVLVLLAVEHESLGHLKMAFGHECHLHLVLDVLHAHTVAEAQPLHDAVQGLGVNGLVLRTESLEQRSFYFFHGERLL